MPVRDWTRVEEGIFRAFHTSWLTHLMGALNGGILPRGYSALSEQDRPTRRSRHLVVRHVSGHQVVALIEIVSPANKDRRAHVRELAEKVVRVLESGVHVLMLDLLPPGRHDPGGLHGAVWTYFDRAAYEPPPDSPLTLVSYAWDGQEPHAYIEPVAVGQALRDMPLFLTADHYVNVPLESTCSEAYRGQPEFWRNVIEQDTPEVEPPS